MDWGVGEDLSLRTRIVSPAGLFSLTTSQASEMNEWYPPAAPWQNLRELLPSPNPPLERGAGTVCRGASPPRAPRSPCSAAACRGAAG